MKVFHITVLNLSTSNALVLGVLFSCCLFASNSQAQDLTGTPVYAAGGGTSTDGFSINAEFRVFSTAKRTAFLMGGLGMYRFSREATYKVATLGLNMVKGNGNHHTELGGAITYNSGAETAGKEVANESLLLYGVGGYRYQRPQGGIFFRIYYAPSLKLKEWGD